MSFKRSESQLEASWLFSKLFWSYRQGDTLHSVIPRMQVECILQHLWQCTQDNPCPHPCTCKSMPKHALLSMSCEVLTGSHRRLQASRRHHACAFNTQLQPYSLLRLCMPWHRGWLLSSRCKVTHCDGTHIWCHCLRMFMPARMTCTQMHWIIEILHITTSFLADHFVGELDSSYCSLIC